MESCYPVYYQYGEYSVNFKHLSKADLELLQEAVRSLGVELSCIGANF